MNQWPIKLIAGEDPPYEGEQLYLTNANNGVAYLYREYWDDFSINSEKEMIKIGWIPASANPPLNQRETPLLAYSKLLPVPAKEQLSPVNPGNVKKEIYVTDIGAETKEERAERLYAPKGISTNMKTDTVTYKGKTYSRADIPAHLYDEIRYAEMYTPKISNNTGGSTKLVPLLSKTTNTGTAFGVPFIANELSTTKEQQTMITQILQINKNAAETAAQLELGRVANATLENILAKKFPNLPSTPFNALVIANLASVIGKQVKPSPKLEKLTNAMVTSAYGEVFQMLDLEGMIKELLDTVGDKLVD